MSMRHLLFALCCGIAGLAQAANVPPDTFTARYRVSMDSVTIGESVRSLERQANGDFMHSTRMAPKGWAAMLFKDSIEERSRFRILRGELQAIEYSYRRSGGKKTRVLQTRFDWPKKLASGTQDGRPWKVALRPGITDPLLYQLAASLDLQRGRTTLSYTVADEGELKPYRLVLAGEAMLETPLGRLDTMKIRHRDSSNETTLWMAKDLAYLPVRIEHLDDGKRIRADIISITGIAATPE